MGWKIGVLVEGIGPRYLVQGIEKGLKLYTEDKIIGPSVKVLNIL